MFDVYEKLPVCHDLSNGKLRTADVLQDVQVKFSSLLLEQKLQNGISKCGYIYLSPIQQSALPPALTGMSLIVHAKSGTGKTLIYLLTALNNFLKHKSSHLQCLILSPTREIAKQVYDVCKNVGCFIEGLNVEYFIGGTPLDIDIIKCKNCHIGIGAPGRIKHLINLGDLKTHELQLLVLDEVDALLNHQEFAISELVSYLPKEKQTIVCTATFTTSIKDLLKPIASNMKYVTVEKTENEDVACTSNVLIGIKQYIAPVQKDCTSLDTVRKRNRLIQILRNFKYDQCFIFVNYISLVKSVCNLLSSHNLPALWISSEQNQSTRINTINQLKLNQCRILVTTDLASRGIDVHNVNLVINLGLPCPPDVYIHRMGRAGRYGSEGAVITLLLEGDEIEQFRKIVSAVSTDPVDLFVLPFEIDETINEETLESIKCLPQQDCSIGNEYYFKRHVKDKQNNMTTLKKKNKKFKKKKNSVSNTNNVKTKIFLQNDVNSKPKSDDITENIKNEITRYVKSLKKKLNGDKIMLNSEMLLTMFSSQRRESSDICFKSDSVEIQKKNNEKNEDQMFLGTVEDGLLQNVRLVKEKNEFLDKQKSPCSVHEVSVLLKRNDNILVNEKSSVSRDLIQELLDKMCTLVPSELSNQEDVLKACANNSLILGNKKSLKRIFQNFTLSDELYNEINCNDTVQNQNNDLLNAANLTSECVDVEHTSKRGKYYHEVKMKEVNLISTEKKASPANKTSTSQHFCCDTVYSQLTEGHVRTHVSEKGAPTRSRSPNSNIANSSTIHPQSDSSESNCVTCPNCRFKFNVPHIRNPHPPLLQSLGVFTNSIMEKNIWNHHFNFINKHVRSMSSSFSNHH